MPEALQFLIDTTGTPAALFAALFFGTFVSEDAACLAAGAAAAGGAISLGGAIAACLLGIMAGDLLLFATGRAAVRLPLARRIAGRWLPRNSQGRVGKWLQENAITAVFVSRFASGLRLPTYVGAGALGVKTMRFAVPMAAAAVLWTPLLVIAAYYQLANFGPTYFLILAGLLVAVRLAIKYASWKERRRLTGRLRRLTHWEFWPVYIFYIPVVAYIIRLGVLHRSLTAFTAANPCLPAGGFKGESKHDIYRMLECSPAARFVLPHVLIPGGASRRERLTAAWSLIDSHRLSFPVVVKPDRGERGRGVRIVRSYDELADALLQGDADLIVQKHVPGVEISIFYYRHPGAATGEIFSITEKTFPYVTGDGNSTIEELVLGDGRAVALASRYLEQRPDIFRVPAAGEEVRLIDIGTHSRGAVFNEGEWLRTPALAAEIDRICCGLDGFYFGRFDIRAPSFEDIRGGRDLAIIELNGVTSESTNIYDRRYSLRDAYRILFRQWKIAFDIGSANMRAGAEAAGIPELARLAAGLAPKLIARPPQKPQCV